MIWIAFFKPCSRDLMYDLSETGTWNVHEPWTVQWDDGNVPDAADATYAASNATTNGRWRAWD